MWFLYINVLHTRLFLCVRVFRILNSTVFESWEIVGSFPSWWVFNLLLVLLQALHIFWSYLILRISCRAISRGKVTHDIS